MQINARDEHDIDPDYIRRRVMESSGLTFTERSVDEHQLSKKEYQSPPSLKIQQPQNLPSYPLENTRKFFDQPTNTKSVATSVMQPKANIIHTTKPQPSSQTIKPNYTSASAKQPNETITSERDRRMKELEDLRKVSTAGAYMGNSYSNDELSNQNNQFVYKEIQPVASTSSMLSDRRKIFEQKAVSAASNERTLLTSSSIPQKNRQTAKVVENLAKFTIDPTKTTKVSEKTTSTDEFQLKLNNNSRHHEANTAYASEKVISSKNEFNSIFTAEPTIGSLRATQDTLEASLPFKTPISSNTESMISSSTTVATDRFAAFKKAARDEEEEEEEIFSTTSKTQDVFHEETASQRTFQENRAFIATQMEHQQRSQLQTIQSDSSHEVRHSEQFIYLFNCKASLEFYADSLLFFSHSYRKSMSYPMNFVHALNSIMMHVRYEFQP